MLPAMTTSQRFRTPAGISASVAACNPQELSEVHDAIDQFEQRLFRMAKSAGLQPHGLLPGTVRPKPAFEQSLPMPAIKRSHHKTSRIAAASTVQYCAEDIARELAARREPCPPQRVAFLMHVHDSNHDEVNIIEQVQSLFPAKPFAGSSRRGPVPSRREGRLTWEVEAPVPSLPIRWRMGFVGSISLETYYFQKNELKPKDLSRSITRPIIVHNLVNEPMNVLVKK